MANKQGKYAARSLYWGINVLYLQNKYQEVIDKSKEFNIEYFIGKEKSPSCGILKTSAYINGKECKCDAMGLTSKILSQNGIKLISEWELSKR